jgi:peptidoglycan hydrolase CwlO-like protein
LHAPGAPPHTVWGVRRGNRVVAPVAAGCIALALLVGAGGLPTGANASLQGSVAASRAKERALRAAAVADSQRAAHFRAPIADLQARQDALQSALDVQQGILNGLQSRLRFDRAHLIHLRNSFKHDQHVLAAQLRASYKTPRPDLVTVVIQAHGFAELLERVDQLKAIGLQNAKVTTRVHAKRDAVAAQTRIVAGDERHQRAVTAAATSERNQVDALRVALVSRQMVFVRARNRHSSALNGLRRRRAALERQLERSAAAAARAQAGAFGSPFGPSPGGGGGSYGFFQAPGTNYSYGDEPEIARRLDRLGKALHLHLIGISGYRTPQHSVEVGGFANDPHTKGKASDTPGVEGVPEGILEKFGLTRPFGGAAEADHIQLVGSA